MGHFRSSQFSSCFTSFCSGSLTGEDRAARRCIQPLCSGRGSACVYEADATVLLDTIRLTVWVLLGAWTNFTQNKSLGNCATSISCAVQSHIKLTVAFQNLDNLNGTESDTEAELGGKPLIAVQKRVSSIPAPRSTCSCKMPPT